MIWTITGIIFGLLFTVMAVAVFTGALTVSTTAVAACYALLAWHSFSSSYLDYKQNKVKEIQ